MRIALLMALWVVLVPLSYGEQAPQISRDAHQLLDQYYFLRLKDPFLARTTLRILLQQYPNNAIGLSEMGYWYLSQKQPENALPFLIRAFNIRKNDQTALQIAFILNQLNRNDEAVVYFKFAAKSPNAHIREKAQKALALVEPPKLEGATAGFAVIPPILAQLPGPIKYAKDSSTAELFALYFYVRKTNLNRAEYILELILKKEPTNQLALKEMGYLKLAIDEKGKALTYFERAYSLNAKDFTLALQIGYIYNELHRNTEAVRYFQYAAQSPDPNIQHKSLKALNNIQTSAPQRDKDAYAVIPSIDVPLVSPAKTQPSVAPLPPPNIALPQDQQDKFTALWSRYYIVRKTNLIRAEDILRNILKSESNNQQALAEMGYLKITLKKRAEAVYYFKKLYDLTHNSQYALQLGYLLAAEGKKEEALTYFKLAYTLGNKDSKIKSSQALAALQTSSTIRKQNLVPPEFFSIAQKSSIEKQKQEVTQAINTLNQVMLSPNINETTETINSLLNEFYKSKNQNKLQAKSILLKILQLDPKNTVANTEMAYLLLAQGDKESAINYFKIAYAVKPSDKIALQIGYSLASLNKIIDAEYYFKAASNSKDLSIRKKALAALEVIRSNHELKSIELPAPPSLTNGTLLWNKYYKIKKTDKNNAKNILLKLLAINPNDIKVLKELGYLTNELKQYKEAYCIFKKVFHLTGEYEIAAQLGYISDNLQLKRDAYYYFSYAVNSPDPALSLKSNISMTNLGGWQTRELSDSFFLDLYMSPLYYTRFDLGVFPVIARGGMYLGKDHRAELYTSIRATKDTQTSADAVSPQIFEDNVAIFAMGARYQLFKNKPLFAFAEAGRGYDLIYRNRDRWRGDFRGGLMYYDRFGKQATYTDKPQYPFAFASDLYMDSIYYTRYDNNWITNIRWRPGLRVMEYGATHVDLYFKLFYIVDTNREFFNNLVEQGPGVVIFPYNRINLDFRFETVRGTYINVNSPSPNPYKPHYSNTIFMVEFYVRF